LLPQAVVVEALEEILTQHVTLAVQAVLQVDFQLLQALVVLVVTAVLQQQQPHRLDYLVQMQRVVPQAAAAVVG
jgi:hypothetical protein